MSRENPIGLTELIEQVKSELGAVSGTNPFFSVDEVTLELQVTVRKEGKGGLQIHVVEIGGAISRDDVQTIKVTFTPLLSKDELAQLYKQRYGSKALEDAAIQIGIKGSGQQSGDEMFGS